VAAADFDSAIPKFESWRPSQPVRSRRHDFRVSGKWRHFRWLAGNGRVFGEENRALPTESRLMKSIQRVWTNPILIDETESLIATASQLGRWIAKFWLRRMNRLPKPTH
jgi:hypothetical protein